MEKYCFGFDIDGTLYPSNHIISANTLETLDKLKKAGHKIVVATGRNYSSVKDSGLLDQIQFDAYVLNNGQCVLDENLKVIHTEKMNPQLVQKIIEVSNSENVVCSLETIYDWFTVQKPSEYVRITHEFFREICPRQKQYEETMDIVMAMVYAPMGYDYMPFKNIDGLRVDIGNSCYADLGIKGYHKYKGIEKCLEYFNISKSVCFGDGSNDVEMIEQATIGIAMGQGAECVKKVSDFVTKSCDEEGIVYACKHFGFI